MSSSVYWNGIPTTRSTAHELDRLVERERLRQELAPARGIVLGLLVGIPVDVALAGLVALLT